MKVGDPHADNAGENRSQEVEDYIESLQVQSRYSAAYEQWQDGQQETAIRTLTGLVRSIKTESGVNVRFWFHLMVTAANASNVTRKKRLGTTPHRAAFGERRTSPNSEHLDAGLFCILKMSVVKSQADLLTAAQKKLI